MFNFGWGSRARVFGIEVFGDHEGKFWYDYGIWPLYRAGRSIRDAIWWIRYRVDPRHRYHMIDTRLDPGYYDIDTLMLNGMFSLLRRYVEREHDGVDAVEKWGNELLAEDDDFWMDSNFRQGRKELEAVALYRWWTVERPAMLKRSEELHSAYHSDESRPLMTFADGDGEFGRCVFREDNESEAAIRVEMDALDERIANEETAMLHRLIGIRGGLWT